MLGDDFIGKAAGAVFRIPGVMMVGYCNNCGFMAFHEIILHGIDTTPAVDHSSSLPFHRTH